MNLRRVGWIIAASITLHAQAQVDGIPKDLIEQRIEAAVEQLGGDENVVIPDGFEKDEEGFYRRESAYDPDFTLEASTRPIPQNNQFIFQKLWRHL